MKVYLKPYSKLLFLLMLAISLLQCGDDINFLLNQAPQARTPIKHPKSLTTNRAQLGDKPNECLGDKASTVAPPDSVPTKKGEAEEPSLGVNEQMLAEARKVQKDLQIQEGASSTVLPALEELLLKIRKGEVVDINEPLQIFDYDLLGFEKFFPLHLAAFYGSESIVRLLLAKGADKEVRDSLGKTAKDLAIASGNEAIIALFP